MKRILSVLLVTPFYCQSAPLPIIPQPVSIRTGDGAFPVSAATVIRYDAKLRNEADLFAADLAKLTGAPPKIITLEKHSTAPQILLDLNPSADIPAGGYKLEITRQAVRVTGKDPAGVFYGTRSILQLLPPPGYKIWETTRPAGLPAAVVEDYPRFAWRGMHLDCGRHFFPVGDIKSFIVWMAFHKLNVFHWHLTEDQGWRIEIKKYPKLTAIGAWRDSTPPYGNRSGSDGMRYGGFYTQDQIRDVVAFAAARHVTIMPEIEMPGHAVAAIAAYPEFGNTDIPGYAPKVLTHWGVQPYIFAPKEETFRFLDDVLTEVCALFPSRFIHIGGDEAPKDQWKRSPFAREVMKREGLQNENELQSWFVRRIQKILAAKGRRLVGWDEIEEGGLPESATMMVWRGENRAKTALARGNDVVMAPNKDTYFDHYQRPAGEELAKGAEFEAIGGFLPISQVYAYNPAAVARNAEDEKHILGVQAQLWSEYFKTWDKVTYMAFPRMAALSEVAWTQPSAKNYDDFLVRLGVILRHYDAAGIKRGDLPER